MAPDHEKLRIVKSNRSLWAILRGVFILCVMALRTLSILRNVDPPLMQVAAEQSVANPARRSMRPCRVVQRFREVQRLMI